MKVAVIERKAFGGTCVNTGCIPTKTMVASAYAANMARRAGEFGIRLQGHVTVDMKAVKARKDAVSGTSRTGVEQWLNSLKLCTVYQGHARFLSAREIAVGAETLRAENIFINVGGHFLPEHLVVIGGSYIGLEFAQMYRRFGSAVTVVEMESRLIAREDEDVSAGVADILQQEGIDIRTNAKCLRVSGGDKDISLAVDCAGHSSKITGSHLLLAVGRRPNTDDLGLEQAGVAVDKRGYIQVDDQLRTSVPGIWALGDCNGKGAFTHTSYNDFEIVAANLLDRDPRRLSERIPAYALYTDPPLGRAGMTEREVRQRNKPALIAKRPMSRVGRAVEKGETQGFIKILVDAGDRRILGAALLGTGGDEVVHSILDLMYASVPYTVMQRAMHIHPTVSELLPAMLGELEPLELAAAA